MKTIFTLLLSTIFSLASMAYDGTRLTVTSISHNKMFVEVDGRRYNLEGNTVSIGNIRPGTHTVRVLRELKRKTGWGISNGNRREQVIYSIRATLRDGFHFDILVNRFGKVMIDERRIDPNDDWYDDDDGFYDNDRNDDRDKDWDDNRGNGNDRYPADSRDNRNNKDVDNDRNDRDNQDAQDDRDEDYDDNYSRSMNSYDFTQAKESLRKEWFENKRLATAKLIIERNYFTSQQVKELMLLFTFENNRLDIAKYAYGKTIDKRNYSVVNDAFTFNSKEKLDQYIDEFEEKNQ